MWKRILNELAKSMARHGYEPEVTPVSDSSEGAFERLARREPWMDDLCRRFQAQAAG